MTDSVTFATLPVAALLTRNESIVAVNLAYEALMGVRADEIVGQSIEAAIRRFVVAPEVAVVDAAASDLFKKVSTDGTLWCRVVDGAGRPRALRVLWQQLTDDDATGVVYLLEAEDDANTHAFAEALARAGGDLVTCDDESVVLERAVNTLAHHGLIATILLLREGDPLLVYGPSKSPHNAEPEARSAIREAVMAVRPPREVLTQFNPRFHERRAAFFRYGQKLIEGTYPPVVVESLKRLVEGRHMVQAPIFVDGIAFGALIVTGASLNPATAGAIEMFTELIARAIESVRLRQQAIWRIEELTRLQGELLQRERLAALGEAAAVMAHEVRNPIAAILNAVSLLRRNEPASAPGVEMYRVIAEEAARLERLVRDLLDLGRPLLPRVRSVDLHAFAAKTIDVLSRRSDPVSHRVELAPCNEPVLLVTMDPDLMELALLNVLTNAAQASAPGGRVLVSIESREDRVLLNVDDAGPGFTPAAAARLFEPFFTTRPTGTGIGLAVVRRIIEANAGTIEVGTSAQGGARVTMSFTTAPPSNRD